MENMPLIIFFRTNLIHFARKLKVTELNYNKYPAERCWLFLSKPDIASGFLSMQISFFPGGDGSYCVDFMFSEATKCF